MTTPRRPSIEVLAAKVAVLERSVARLNALVAPGDRDRRQMFAVMLTTPESNPAAVPRTQSSERPSDGS